MTHLLDTLKRTNTILYCDHWAETVDFYKTKLDLPIAFENDWFVEFQLSETSFLSIANAARATVTAVAGQGITITWEVAELEKVQQHLTAQNITTTPIQHKWGAFVFYCHDPEGHRLEFWAQESRNKNSQDE